MTRNPDAFDSMAQAVTVDTARLLRVPPWLVDHRYAVPRRRRLAWLTLRAGWWLQERALKKSATPADEHGGPVPTAPARHTPQPSKEDT